MIGKIDFKAVGSYAYLEFDQEYHGEQVPQIYPLSAIRHIQMHSNPNPEEF